MGNPWIGIKLFELELCGYRLCHFLILCLFCSSLWSLNCSVIKGVGGKNGNKTMALHIVLQSHCFSQIGKLQHFVMDAVFNDNA